MLIEVVGGDEFVANRITGGLSKYQYIRANVATLFPELMELKEGTDGYHPVLKGFQVETDNRGYTTQITMDKSSARAFSARFDSVEAYKLSTYVDYLEDEARKKEIEAITDRVKNQYRVKEITFDDMKVIPNDFLSEGIKAIDFQ